MNLSGLKVLNNLNILIIGMSTLLEDISIILEATIKKSN
jgi:hypothetical protein